MQVQDACTYLFVNFFRSLFSPIVFLASSFHVSKLFFNFLHQLRWIETQKVSYHGFYSLSSLPASPGSFSSEEKYEEEGTRFAAIVVSLISFLQHRGMFPANFFTNGKFFQTPFLSHPSSQLHISRPAHPASPVLFHFPPPHFLGLNYFLLPFVNYIISLTTSLLSLLLFYDSASFPCPLNPYPYPNRSHLILFIASGE